jgi:hypothetical protein
VPSRARVIRPSLPGKTSRYLYLDTSALVKRYIEETGTLVEAAAALEVKDSLTAADLPALTFVAADEDLVSAVQAEWLPSDDPNRHP